MIGNRSRIWKAIVLAALPAAASCATTMRHPDATCSFSHDQTEFISDSDYEKFGIRISGYEQARDNILRNPNFPDFLNRISSNRRQSEWILAVEAARESGRYQLSYISYSADGCPSQAITAMTGSSFRFDVITRELFLDCEAMPIDTMRDRLSLEARPLEGLIASHQAERFLIWGIGSDVRCSKIVEYPEDYVLWREILNGLVPAA